MSFQTSNSANAIRQELYASTVQDRLSRWLIGRPLFNNKTGEFPDGDELEITQIGQRVLREYTEGSDVDFTNVDLTRIQLSVTDYVQDAWFMTDKMKQDSHQAAAIWSKQVADSSEAYMQRMEQDVLATSNQQTLSDPNLINGEAHRFVGTGSQSGTPASTDRALSIQDFINAKLAFDRARVPSANRVAIIDPKQEAIINQLVDIQAVTTGSQFNYDFQGLVQEGFGTELGFNRNIMGFNIMLSHELPRVGAETVDGVTVDNGVANIFMSMASADHMPFMGVIRQEYSPEFDRNASKKRDEWSATGRHGFAIQRPECLAVALTTV